MLPKLAIHYSNLYVVAVCLFTIGVMVHKKLAKLYPTLVALLAVRGIVGVIAIAFLFHRKDLGLSLPQAYKIYFYSYWTATGLQILLQFLVIYSVYRILMRPLEGLKEMGKIIFRWVTLVSIVLSLMLAFGPHGQATNSFASILGQVQEGESVLTVCLLVFVSFATRPLGLTFRSHSFGTILGLGISATSGLVISAWFSNTAAQSVYSPVFAWGGIFSAVTLTVWMTYFALPEPQRKLILLPTTSPYFHWNQISEALGDDPGLVAIGGAAPSMFATAELEAFFAGTNPEAHPAAILAEPEPLRLDSLAARAS